MSSGFSRIAVIGLGLIGGSVARGLRRALPGVYITAFDPNDASILAAVAAGVIDAGYDTVKEASDDADIVVVAVPVQSMGTVFESLATSLVSGAQVITDTGSVKRSVYDAAREACGGLEPVNFVPGHPIAGSEQHGFGAAIPDLFLHHKVILTPVETTRPEATRLCRDLWEMLGADVVSMSPEHHDLVLAQTSHLPHLLAFALVDTLSMQGDSMEIFEYAAGGFRDFSRIAASDPIMWRDVFASNKQPVVEILDKYLDELGEIRDMIVSGRLDELAEIFARSKTARDHFSTLIEARRAKREGESG